MTVDEFPMLPTGRPLWLITLADLALLLVGFFVLMQANTELDPRALASGIRQGFGVSAPEKEEPIPVAAAAMLNFAPGSAVLPAAPDSLAAWARESLRDPRVSLKVTGTVDGSAADVDAASSSGAVLAADRARAVAAALAGIAPGRMTIVNATNSKAGRRQVIVTLAFPGTDKMSRCGFALPFLLLAAPATAQSFQDPAGLDRAVAAFTAHAIGEAGGARANVDTRLKLATCSMVSVSWRTASHDAVVVSCLGPEWRIFVPVLSDGTAVAASAPAVRAVAGPPVIKRGDPVMIEANQNGFSITREGVAMGDAPTGGRVMIRVTDAKTPVQAVAIESGRATLPGWTE